MTGMSFLLGGDDPGDEFDENESKDLGMHVRQCGRRYRALDRKLNFLIKLVAIGFLIMYASNIPSVVKGLMTLIAAP